MTPTLFCPSSAPMAFRAYQEKMIASWFAAMDRGIRRGLIISATGTGKTQVFSGIVGQAWRENSKRSLVLAHSIELIEQNAARIASMNPGMVVGIERAEDRADYCAHCISAGVQTLAGKSNRLDWFLPNILVCDEAHHAAADSFQNVFQRFGAFDDRHTALLGVTATPHRLDNKALVGSKAIFEEIIFRYDIADAIRDGFLVDLRGYRAKADFDLGSVKVRAGDYVQRDLESTMNTEAVNEHAFNAWRDVAADRPTIVFCAGVDHAQAMAEIFKANGVRAEAIWGDMPSAERDAAINRFRSGETRVLTNMNILTEGFDAQHCSCILLLRPTQSWTLFTQMVGRALRTLPGVIDGVDSADDRRNKIGSSDKPDCIVIDIVGNTDRHRVSANKDGTGRPSLQSLVGLPEHLDLEGRTISKAIEDFDALPDTVKSAAFRRPTSFSGLTTTLMQVSMLSELDVPEEVAECGAKMYWLKTSDLHYDIDLGTDKSHGWSQRASIIGDLLGRWKLVLGTYEQSRPLTVIEKELPDDLTKAFFVAESAIIDKFPGAVGIANRYAKWRKDAPTPGQLAYLERLGVEKSIMDGLNKGRASAMITILKRQVGA